MFPGLGEANHSVPKLVGQFSRCSSEIVCILFCNDAGCFANELLLAAGVKRFHVLDLYGASQQVAMAWSRAQYKALCFDIKLDVSNDITSASGFKALLRGGLQRLASICFVIFDRPIAALKSVT